MFYIWFNLLTVKWYCKTNV